MSKTPVPMEMLDIDKSGYGQNYGYILYRTFIPKGGTLKFSKPVADRVQVSVATATDVFLSCAKV